MERRGFIGKMLGLAAAGAGFGLGKKIVEEAPLEASPPSAPEEILLATEPPQKIDLPAGSFRYTDQMRVEQLCRLDPTSSTPLVGDFVWWRDRSNRTVTTSPRIMYYLAGVVSELDPNYRGVWVIVGGPAQAQMRVKYTQPVIKTWPYATNTSSGNGISFKFNDGTTSHSG